MMPRHALHIQLRCVDVCRPQSVRVHARKHDAHTHRTALCTLYCRRRRSLCTRLTLNKAQSEANLMRNERYNGERRMHLSTMLCWRATETIHSNVGKRVQARGRVCLQHIDGLWYMHKRKLTRKKYPTDPSIQL